MVRPVRKASCTGYKNATEAWTAKWNPADYQNQFFTQSTPEQAKSLLLAGAMSLDVEYGGVGAASLPTLHCLVSRDA